ncbi:MAG: hypothetical protein MI867_23625 [Pseudomonadales bacterium]|nr:hypothetical protein [Pseudomonadales bacterium]
MVDKNFTLQRIKIYLGGEVDPNSDAQITELLRDKFNVVLPQRRSMNESLRDCTSDHEIVGLILKYRSS